MNDHILLSAALLAVSFLLVAGCRPNVPRVTNDEIATITDMDTLMWAQADFADPGFDLAEDTAPDALTEAQLRQLATIGERLELTGKRLDSFAEGRARWGELSAELAGKASALRKAAQGGDGAGAIGHMLSIRETCRTCHSEFR